ncbi:unnamed protein product, partial [Tenebrio molitor]
MVLLREHKVFMVEAYFRNGTKVDGNWEYSVSACFEEFQERFPIVAIVYEQFRQTLHLCLNNFRESGTIGRKEGSGQVKKRTQEVIGNVQQIMEDSPTTSIRHLSQQVDLSVGTCQKILKEDLHLFPYRLTAVNYCNHLLLMFIISNIFAGNINGERYRAEILTPFLNELHDDALIYGYFQQDGATAHTTGATINFLSNFYADRLISRNTLNNWPPRSYVWPALTPLDYYLFPHLKNTIF